MTDAKIIADSISPDGVRLTTMQVTLHRFVLAELNTHRVLSKNSASSRAIPLRKQLVRVEDDLASPVSWPREKSGMQGGEEIEGVELNEAQYAWKTASLNAIQTAEQLREIGVHKSVANRLLEPFLHHTVVITATAWTNFFDQRCSPLAQPEIKAAADLMLEAYTSSTPKQLQPGEWHLPYIEPEDWGVLRDRYAQDVRNLGKSMYSDMVKISAARCARVSYLTQDGRRDLEEDLSLYARLTTARPAHWSPLEHVATPWPLNRQDRGVSDLGRVRHHDPEPLVFTDVSGTDLLLSTRHLPRVGNLLGWRSLRTEVEALQGEVTYR